MQYPQKEKALEPGIHFGVSDEVYHGDSAVSRSQLAGLLDEDGTPHEVWLNSWMNPSASHGIVTEAMKHGKAFHLYFLEPDLFHEYYRVEPGDPYSHSKMAIKRTDYQEIVYKTKILKDMRRYEKLFTGGYPEVSIVWPDPETGLMLRTKHDYFGIFQSTDLKTTRSMKDKSLRYEYDEYFYRLQGTMYTLARREVRKLIKMGLADVYGEHDPEFIRKFLKEENDYFVFVFQRKTRYPYKARVLPFDDTDFELGYDEMRKGIKRYIYNLEKYGTNPWPICEGEYEEFSSRYGTQTHGGY